MGPIVFADPAALARLNAIVWPEIARMAREKADSLWKVPSPISVKLEINQEGKQVVVLDAAVLLEAGWQNFCHEVIISTFSSKKTSPQAKSHLSSLL